MGNNLIAIKLVNEEFSDYINLNYNRWYCYFSSRLINMLDEKDTPSGELIGISVCSKEYLENPDMREIIDEGEKTIIMENFDKDEVIKLVQEIIDLINAKKYNNWKIIFDDLENYFNIED